jgi:methyl-accepting chemotaxis protein
MQVADQIGVSTQAQQSTCEQVAAAMRNITDVAKHTAEAASETGQATSELLELANSMEATVGSIKTEVS